MLFIIAAKQPPCLPMFFIAVRSYDQQDKNRAHPLKSDKS